jgi:hypothetical protein
VNASGQSIEQPDTNPTTLSARCWMRLLSCLCPIDSSIVVAAHCMRDETRFNSDCGPLYATHCNGTCPDLQPTAVPLFTEGPDMASELCGEGNCEASPLHGQL